MAPPKQEWLTTLQTAEALGLSHRTTRHWALQGRMGARRLEGFAYYLFPYWTVEQVARQQGLSWAQPAAGAGGGGVAAADDPLTWTSDQES